MIYMSASVTFPGFQGWASDPGLVNWSISHTPAIGVSQGAQDRLIESIQNYLESKVECQWRTEQNSAAPTVGTTLRLFS